MTSTTAYTGAKTFLILIISNASSTSIPNIIDQKGIESYYWKMKVSEKI